MSELISRSMSMVARLDAEVVVHFKSLRDAYHPRFPELESVLLKPYDFARAVRRIGAEEDLTRVAFEGIVDNQTIMVISLSASASVGRPMPAEQLARAMEECDTILSLGAQRDLLVAFVERRMGTLAPNLCALLGSEVASQLVTIAGGIEPLSKIPGGTLSFLGKKKTTGVFIASGNNTHKGFIWNAPVVSEASQDDRVKVHRILCTRAALCSRLDAFGGDAAGAKGQHFLDEIRKKIAKWDEPNAGKTVKAIKAPDAVRKKRRGGKRYRAMKERMAVSEMEKRANRVTFNAAREDDDDSEDDHVRKRIASEVTGEGTGGGPLRGPGAKVTKTGKGRVLQKIKEKEAKMAASNGFQTSFAITPVQGIELSNPQAVQERIKQANQKYFGQGLETPFLKKN